MYNIYGLKWCIFCLRAINFMQEKGLEFHYYPMDESPVQLTSLKDIYNHKTVPLITEKVTDGWRLIGGYDDFVKYIRQQEDEESNTLNP